MPLLRLARALVALVATVAVLGLVPLPASGAAPSAPGRAAAGSGAAKGDTLLKRIKALGPVDSVREQKRNVPDGFRFFHITVTQPVDHDDPQGPMFDQRITLLHRSAKRPMVLYTGGYNLYGQPFRSEPTAIVNGNQIEMEYRFFKPSRPKHPDWEQQLTIAQAAADEHRIIRAFQKIYKKNWLTTGGSKGGMTATYHRRFYPDDVDGTVPYVAPNDVVDDDDVYNDFLDEVGGAQYADCRDAIVANERRALGDDRAWFREQFDQEVDDNGYTFDIVGDPDVAFEATFVDTYFGFWQYHDPSAECADVPGPDASRRAVLNWFEDLDGAIGGYNADQGIKPYVPYFFQASYQLGAPEPYEPPLADLLQHPGADVASTFVPDRLLDGVEFDDAAMPDIDQWVREDSSQMLYVYGQFDPWSAEPFACADDPAGVAEDGAGHDCYRFYEPGGNHGSSIAGLQTAQREQAIDLVRSWAGLAPAKTGRTGWARIPALDDGWQRAYLRR